ncbi:MAG: beta-lactamase family protein [Alphaproteobacteria bacterium]|nr:beta-lactamase family protein [Alphaproteobacteria bacterium]
MKDAWGELDALLAQAVDAGVTPSVDLCVRLRGETLRHVRLGMAQLHPLARPLGDAPRWDLASLTKPLAGAALCYALIDAGALGFEDEVRQVVPEVPAGVQVQHLLSHSSGYPAWRPLYERVDAAGLAWGSPAARRLVLREAATTPLEAAPGAAHRYSDLGFLVLCDLMERVGGARIDRLWRERVARPGAFSGLSWGGGNVATEDCPRRRGVVVGAVHDLNCASMGGVSSHAGLFGDAPAVAWAGQVFLDAFHGRGPLAGSAIRHAWTHRGAGSHWLGWDGRSAGGSSSGALFPDDAVGHLGFTGTSIWIAPGQELVVVLLTNRVHPSVEDTRIRALRPAVHDAVLRSLIRLGRW